MKPIRKSSLWLTTGLLATMGGVALIQNRASGQSHLNKTDRMFLMKAEQSNLAEIRTSRIALDKDIRPGLKDFAQHMVDDHTAAENDLKQVAENERFLLPMEPDARSRAMAERLMNLNGAAFDHSYFRAQHDGHVATIALFKREIAYGRDPEVRTFAQKYLPKIEDHLHDLMAMSNGVRMHRRM